MKKKPIRIRKKENIESLNRYVKNHCCPINYSIVNETQQLFYNRLYAKFYRFVHGSFVFFVNYKFSHGKGIILSDFFLVLFFYWTLMVKNKQTFANIQ